MKNTNFDLGLAPSITKTASAQTFYTIRYLVDSERVADAYRAYAYFRWVDDALDAESMSEVERSAFIQRQKSILQKCYQHESPLDANIQETMLVDLVRGDHEKNSALRHVTPSSHSQDSGLTHMLRDTFDDVQAGYFNIPCEVLDANRITPFDVESKAYRSWVKSRVILARQYFHAGRDYLSRVQNPRCRLAGFAYMARFEWLLDTFEREGYLLRPQYEKRKSLGTGLRMMTSALSSMINFRGTDLPQEKMAHQSLVR